MTLLVSTRVVLAFACVISLETVAACGDGGSSELDASADTGGPDTSQSDGASTDAPAEADAGDASSGFTCSPQTALASIWYVGSVTSLDEQLLRSFAARARVVVLRIDDEGPTYAPTRDAKSVIARLHTLCPTLPVLLYEWASHGVAAPKSDQKSGPSNGWLMPDYLTAVPLLQTGDAGPCTISGGDEVLGDMTSAVTQQYVAAHALAAVTTYGADGVAFDLARRSLGKAGGCNVPASFAAGMDATFLAVKNALPAGKLLYFNGLWNVFANELDDQVTLLQNGHADGANIEYYGYEKSSSDGTYQHNIEDDVAAYTKIGSALVIPHGRSPSNQDTTDVYESWAQALAWERYVRAGYLVNPPQQGAFRFGANDSSDPVSPSRSAQSNQFYDEIAQAALGDVQGTTVTQGGDGLYVRAYAHGVVVVNPSATLTASYASTGTHYTPEGAAMTGALSVPPQTGLLLLDAALPAYAPPAQDFESSMPPPAPASWMNAAIKTDQGSRYLALMAMQAGSEFEHDLILDPVLSKTPPRMLSMRVRTSDATATMTFAVDVDDPALATSRVAAVLGGPAPPATGPALQFHDASIGTATWPYHQITSATLMPDGQWHTINLAAGALGSAYTLRRWAYVRIAGTVDIDDVNVAP